MTPRRRGARAAARGTIEHVDGAEVVVEGGRRLVSFGGCDYLGLAKHDEVVSAAHAALDFLGASASASRTTTGTMDVHVALEETLRAYFGTEAAVHFASGWLAPQAAARALATECDAVLLDGGAHPALADAALLTGLPVRTFPPRDARAARRLAARDRVLVLTDGPPRLLRPLAALARRNRGHLVVDDAHGAGVLGRTGCGAVEAAGVAGPRVHLAGSLAKAFGAQGGFVAGDAEFIAAVRGRADVVAGATPLAPASAAAAECALRIAAEGTLRRALWRNVARMRRHLASMGVAAPRDRAPWFALGSGLPRTALDAWSARLAVRGFLVPIVHYYGEPAGDYLKVTITAIHTAAQIDAVAGALAETRKLSPPAAPARRRTPVARGGNTP